MAYIILPHRWALQPPAGGVGVNWGNPLTSGLILAHNFNSVELGTRNLAGVLPNSSFEDIANVSRAARNFRGTPVIGLTPTATTAEITFSRQALHDTITTSGAVSVVQVLKSNGNDGLGNLSLPLWQSDVGTFEHYPYDDGKIYLGPFSQSRWANGLTVPAGYSITEPHVLGFRHKAGAQAMFFNGISIGTNTDAVAPKCDPAAGGGGPRIGTNGVAYAVFVWKRLLSDSEFFDISSNPWQLFQPIRRRLGIDVVAGGGGGRTTKNTRAWPLGMEIGMNWRGQI